jgi:chlorite dismutase
MDPRNSQKEPNEPGPLRLVPESKDPRKFPLIDKQFVSFMFFRINSEYRKLDDDTKSTFKKEFQNVYEEFSSDFLLFSYSLVGFDSKADMMFWRVGTSLDLVQDMTAKLYRTNLGNYLETADNYLSDTKKMMFVSDSTEDRCHINAGEKKYLFIYPCAKSRE